MPVIADSGATEYHRPLLEGLHDELYRLAPDARVVPADTVRPALQVDGRASAYRTAYATRHVSANERAERRAASRYRPRPGRTRSRRALFARGVRAPPAGVLHPHEGPHKDLSTRQTVEVVALVSLVSLVWDARSLLGRWTETLAETPASRSR